jgi:hypothetical protein
MPNLIPQKRLDRNGRLVTKHVRVDPKTAAASGSLPAPVLASKTVVFPDGSHKEAVRIVLYNDNLRPDPELARIFGGMNGTSMNLYGTSPEMYSVLSVLAPGDAAFLMTKGIDSAESVHQFLAEHSLERLVVDNSDIVQEATRRRIPAASYLRIADSGNRNLSKETAMDAAEAHGMKDLRQYDFYLDIMRGYLTLKDIKDIGVSTITKHSQPNDIRDYLWEINKGESAYTTKELKSLIQKSTKAELSIALTERIAKRFGMKFTLGLNDLTESFDMMNYLDRNKYSHESAKPIVEHFDEMARHRKATSGPNDWNNLQYDDCLKFYAAGIEPAAAWDAVSQGVTVEQVLAMRQGIAPSISGGWL